MDTKERLNNTIKVVCDVLEKHKDNPSIKKDYKSIKKLKEKRNIE